MNIYTSTSEQIYAHALMKLKSRILADGKKGIVTFLSGGSVVRLYKELADFLRDTKIENVAFAQADERWRPNFQFSIFNFQTISNNLNINASQIERTGLWEICKEKNIPYFLVSQEGTLEISSVEYNKTVARLFQEYKYKIAILGVGEDGHTAGLLPGYQKLWDIKKLVAGYRNTGQFPHRITLTPFALRQMDYVLVIAKGEIKKEALQNILNPENKKRLNRYPGAILQEVNNADLFND